MNFAQGKYFGRSPAFCSRPKGSGGEAMNLLVKNSIIPVLLPIRTRLYMRVALRNKLQNGKKLSKKNDTYLN